MCVLHTPLTPFLLPYRHLLGRYANGVLRRTSRALYSRATTTRCFHEYYSYRDEEPDHKVISYQPESSSLRLLTTGYLSFAKRPRRRGKHKSDYAILSHTWREDDNEITYDDLKHGSRSILSSLPAWDKIDYTNKQAKRDGLEFFWIDSCCIDKSSSAELSEAINSMYSWYADAKVCYVHLADFDASSGWEHFRRSRWFSRAWTLQELLAPQVVKFYDRFWNYIGSLEDERLLENVSTATGIPVRLLAKELTLQDFSIAQRMSWAAHRTATRIEDRAYSLLGIFDVNMPMLYGERQRAFVRLQEEIIKTSTDHSILCWEENDDKLLKQDHRDLLAISPSAFARCGDIIQRPDARSTPYRMTNLGLEITLPLHQYLAGTSISDTFAKLDCARESKPTEQLALNLRRKFDLRDKDPSAELTYTNADRYLARDMVKVYWEKRLGQHYVSAFAGTVFYVGHAAASPRLRVSPAYKDTLLAPSKYRSETILIARDGATTKTRSEDAYQKQAELPLADRMVFSMIGSIMAVFASVGSTLRMPVNLFMLAFFFFLWNLLNGEPKRRKDERLVSTDESSQGQQPP